MKKFLLIVFFFISSIGLKAQSWVYHPFPADSVVWFEKLVYSDGIQNYHIYQTMGDTTIGAFTYNTLYTSALFLFPFYSPSTTLYYNGGIRQDIPNKKVYRIDELGTEKLLYDFNLSIGDTVAFTGTGDTIYVSSIDSVLVGSVYHKRFGLISSMDLSSGFIPGDLIDGVGCTAGIDNWYIQRFEGSAELLCYSYQSVKKYPSSPTAYPCALTVGISEILNGKVTLSVMPNPTSDIVFLLIDCKDSYSIEVKNSIGQSIFSKTDLILSESRIDFSDYTNGIYFVRLSDLKGNSIVKKIIKN